MKFSVAQIFLELFRFLLCALLAPLISSFTFLLLVTIFDEPSSILGASNLAGILFLSTISVWFVGYSLMLFFGLPYLVIMRLAKIQSKLVYMVWAVLVAVLIPAFEPIYENRSTALDLGYLQNFEIIFILAITGASAGYVCWSICNVILRKPMPQKGQNID